MAQGGGAVGYGVEGEVLAVCVAVAAPEGDEDECEEEEDDEGDDGRDEEGLRCTLAGSGYRVGCWGVRGLALMPETVVPMVGGDGRGVVLVMEMWMETL